MNIRCLLPIALLAALISAPGCTLKPQHLLIDPTVRVKDSRIGDGKTIGLAVADARSTRKLGEVGNPDDKMVDVIVDQDFSPVVYGRISEALARLGFNVVPYTEGAERTLSVEFHTLELQSVKQPFTFDTELRAEVVAHAANANSSYDRQFSVRTHKQSGAPPFEKDSTVLVNTAISQALEDLFADDPLLALLAR